jgi:4-aminobutyrate aminotransferase/(S)-3-amino-2-methylpropionate transaminase
VLDADGNRYVDLTGGFAVSAIAHGHPPIVSALKNQAERLMHALGDVHPSDSKVQLLAKLASLAPWPARVILGLSGADAVEAALKTALLYTKKPGVIAFRGGYHGLSHGPLAACGYGEAFREPFAGQLNPHVRFAPYPSEDSSCESALHALDAEIAALSDQAGALLVEPIQGRAGVNVPPQGFLRAACERARARGLVVIVDEIYTGLGRSGHLFAHLQQEAEADLVCLGKALGGGLPVSACLGKEHVMAAWGDPAGEAIHTSTFLGNPLASATAIAFLAEFERLDLPARMSERGAAFRNALIGLSTKHGLTVRGSGLMLGVALGAPERVLAAMRGLLERGYIVLPAGAPPSVLCLTPPACITDAQVAGFCSALDAVLSGLS